jgi:signal transduction histidine kinase
MPRARGWSLRRRVGVTFSALAVLLAVLLTAIFVSLADVIDKADQLVDRWQPAVANSQELRADVASQDSAVRGYALSGGSAFLQRYQQFRTAESAAVSTLRRLLAGHESLLAQLAAFEKAAGTWQAQTAQPLIAATQAHDPTVTAEVSSARNQARFAAALDRAQSLTSALRRSSDAAEARRQQAATVLTAALIVAAVLLVGVGVLVWWGLHRWVLGPVDRLAAQTRDVAAGAVGQVIGAEGPPELVNLGNDTETMRRQMAAELDRLEQAHAELRAQGEELARSNADLEQFAYVASHDLSEPLRKVTNFCQLLERQYGPQLDDKARQYIAFAVDGAKRMQTLITDLLSFSRVGRSTDEFVPVDLDAALAQALTNLDTAITEAGARVASDPLPVVPGDEALLVALFQNLVSNAVKYRSAQPPNIRISARRAGDEWEFAVADNGIGIEPQYAERIFAIFQRLHVRGEYSGTGIGLALCRRIVDFHGGRIWLDTDAGEGATFRFALPAGSEEQPDEGTQR